MNPDSLDSPQEGVPSVLSSESSPLIGLASTQIAYSVETQALIDAVLAEPPVAPAPKLTPTPSVAAASPSPLSQVPVVPSLPSIPSEFPTFLGIQPDLSEIESRLDPVCVSVLRTCLRTIFRSVQDKGVPETGKPTYYLTAIMTVLRNQMRHIPAAHSEQADMHLLCGMIEQALKTVGIDIIVPNGALALDLTEREQMRAERRKAGNLRYRQRERDARAARLGNAEDAVSDQDAQSAEDTEEDEDAESYDPEFLDTIDPSAPCNALPGSEEKVIMLAARYQAGMPLWNNEDRSDREPRTKASELRAIADASMQNTNAKKKKDDTQD